MTNPMQQAGPVAPVTRKCRDCQETKESCHFVKNKTFSHGIDTLCLMCNQKRVKQYRAAGKANRTLESQRRYKKHPEQFTSYSAKRRAVKRNAVPNWLTEWDEFVIDELYDLAQKRTKTTGILWHVDHIIPLQSKLVCGLHVPANLQVIPAKDNLRKGNSYDGTGKHRVN